MSLKINDGRVIISPMNSLEKNHLSKMGATEGKLGFSLPLTIGVLNEVYTKFVRLRKNEELLQAGYDLREKRKRLVEILKDPPQIAGDPLRPYQRADVNYILEQGSCGVFNQPRTGKTPTVLEALNQKRSKRVIIVCPASLIYTWESQVRRWTQLQPHVIDKNPAATLASFNVLGGALIVSKNTLPKIIPQLENLPGGIHRSIFDTAIVDEAHYLRNYKTNQSKAVYKIIARDRIALTGTPSVKHPSDIFGILKFLYPNVYRSYWAFCDRYFHVGQTEYGKEVYQLKKQREAEMENLMLMIGTTRKREDFMAWLPKKQYTDVICEMGDKQRKHYEEMKKWFETYDEETDTLIDTEQVITQCMRLRQITLDPRLLGFKLIGAKTKMLYQLIEDRGEPIIIMSMFTSYLKMIEGELKEKGYRVSSIHGQMSGKEKQASADAFQEGKVDVLLCNIISAGTGWTLDKGKSIVFMDTAWNPSDNEQAEDRVTPTIEANYHEHNVIHMVAKNSFDSHMFKLLKKKQSLTDIINSGGVKELIRMM